MSFFPLLYNRIITKKERKVVIMNGIMVFGVILAVVGGLFQLGLTSVFVGGLVSWAADGDERSFMRAFWAAVIDVTTIVIVLLVVWLVSSSN